MSRMEITGRRASTAVMLGALFVCDSPAFAQDSTMPSVGMTSPLGIGPASPVAPVGVPLGATAIQEPGVSPLTSGGSPVVATTTTSPACRASGGAIPESSYGIGSSTPGMSTGAESLSSGMGGPMDGTSYGTGISTAGTSMSTTTFDGGGMAGSASGTCTPIDTGSLAGPAASASSPTGVSVAPLGRVGIPMGSTQLGAGGLSPMPTISTTSTLPLSTTPCPTTGMPSATGMPTYSGPC
jgi:hypothetical protein